MTTAMLHRRGFFVGFLALSATMGVALALQAPNVTGAAIQPQGAAKPTHYEVTITLHPGDPRIHDFHLYWNNTPGKPKQASWSGPAGWTTNVADNVVPPSGTPQTSGNVDSISFTSSAGAAAGAGVPITLKFTYSPWGGKPGQQPPAATIYWYATSDGTSGLPAGGYADPDVEGWGMVTLVGLWNFPAWPV